MSQSDEVTLRRDEMILRRLLWLRHGCRPLDLYGDDGEMQCSRCGLDFKRMSPQQIEEHFTDETTKRVIKFLENQNGTADKAG